MSVCTSVLLDAEDRRPSLILAGGLTEERTDGAAGLFLPQEAAQEAEKHRARPLGGHALQTSHGDRRGQRAHLQGPQIHVQVTSDLHQTTRAGL